MARRVLGAFAVTVTAALTTLALTGTAQAHTPTLNKGCDEKTGKSWFTVSLKDYGREKDNFLEVTIDGKAQPKISFKGKLDEKKYEEDGSAKHTYEVKVTAYDDPNFEKKWSFTASRTTEACVKTPPTTTTKPTTTTTTPPATSPEVPSSSEVPPTTTTTEVAPGGSAPEPPLAATGASPMWLLLSGLGLVGAGAGTLLFLRRRRSA
ncbi:LPXTG cell wall anchor domain-containing protein [Lentzea sp. JNUCC 0626]|uniref:LPXTG cell wall anchor domain-containing protein n=1 Tax=Lentzea sp. JNUCC 0626 TaxID=3367513 RepID=UPI003749F009